MTLNLITIAATVKIVMSIVRFRKERGKGEWGREFREDFKSI